MSYGCCRGGPVFVCRNCRTTAKGWDVKTGHGVDYKYTNKKYIPNCPSCRNPMINMGPKFRVSRKWIRTGKGKTRLEKELLG